MEERSDGRVDGDSGDSRTLLDPKNDTDNNNNHGGNLFMMVIVT